VPTNTEIVHVCLEAFGRGDVPAKGILQDDRSFGIHTILANQSLSDLKSPTGFDLAPGIGAKNMSFSHEQEARQ